MSNITTAGRLSMQPIFRDFFDVENFFSRPFQSEKWPLNYPAVNISESEHFYNVELAVPGFKKEDFKIKIEEDVLTVSAEESSEEKKEEKNYSRREYQYASFSRSFRLPDNVEDEGISASYNEGMLKLLVPKSAKSAHKSTEISVG